MEQIKIYRVCSEPAYELGLRDRIRVWSVEVFLFLRDVLKQITLNPDHEEPSFLPLDDMVTIETIKKRPMHVCPRDDWGWGWDCLRHSAFVYLRVSLVGTRM